MVDPGTAATEDDLRALVVDGYHAPQQYRTVETTRRLLAAGWQAMADDPTTPLRLEAVLARSGASASSFYSRFDGVDALVACLGLLALRRAPIEVGSLDGASRTVVAPLAGTGHLPREVLAAGMWSDAYVEAQREARPAAIRRLAIGAAGPDAEVRRLVTWLTLAEATAEQWWAVGGLVLGEDELAGLADELVRLGAQVVGGATRPVGGATTGGPQLDAPRVAPRVGGASDRSAVALAELRTSTREALVQHGRDLSPADVARAVHRSRTAFFDAFGTVGAALADLARTEQSGRIPTQLFRPRADVGPDALVGHLVHRIRAWQDHQGIVGRRLLQAAGEHPELARELVGQVLASADLLAGWYAPAFALAPQEVRLLFVALLAAEQHQVVWGAQPDVILGPDALDALLGPVLCTEVSAVPPPVG